MSASPVLAQTDATDHHGLREYLRRFLVVLLAALAVLSFGAYMAVRWVEHQVLQTENWVAYASDLPRNADVSSALARTMTTQLFNNVPVEQIVADALPPRATFLAGPLSDQLHQRTAGVAQRLITSDAFLGLWTGANRVAMDRLLTNARTFDPDKQTGAGLQERFSIDLSSAVPALRERLGSESTIFPAVQDKAEGALTIATDLQTKREQLWRWIQTADAFYAVLPAVFVAAGLGAAAFAHDRRKVLLVIAAWAIIAILIELIMVKYGRQRLLDRVNVPENIPAVSYIYDSLLSPLRSALLGAFWLWLGVLILACLTSPWAWAQRLREALHIPGLSRMRLGALWVQSRLYVRRFRYVAWGAIVAGLLLYLAFGAQVTGVELVRSVAIAVAAMCAVRLFVYPSRQPVTQVTAHTKTTKYTTIMEGE
jgi:hypothetical protein